MRIVVLLKQVPETSAPRARQGQLDLADATRVLNPLDRYAVEEALRLEEGWGQGAAKTLALSAGEEGAAGAAAVIREALAMGLARGAVVAGLGVEQAETGVGLVARILAAAIRLLGGADLVLCGQRSLDLGSGMLPPAVAECLGLPFLPEVACIEGDQDGRVLTVARLAPLGRAFLRVKLPCLLSLVKTPNEPRLASLRGLMAAKRAEIPILAAADLVPQAAASAGIATRGTVTYAARAPCPPARMISGSVAEQARRLVEELRAAGVSR